MNFTKSESSARPQLINWISTYHPRMDHCCFYFLTINTHSLHGCFLSHKRSRYLNDNINGASTFGNLMTSFTMADDISRIFALRRVLNKIKQQPKTHALSPVLSWIYPVQVRKSPIKAWLCNHCRQWMPCQYDFYFRDKSCFNKKWHM